MRTHAIHCLKKHTSRWGKWLAVLVIGAHGWTGGYARLAAAEPYAAPPYQGNANYETSLSDIEAPPIPPPHQGSTIPQVGVGEIVSSWDEGEMIPVDPTFGCPPGWTVQADAMFFDREGESNVSASSAFRLNGFDTETAGRLSLQRHWDCSDGWELTYVGPFEFEQQGSVTGVGLNNRLTFSGAALTTFNNAVFHSQRYTSKLNSVEFNRKYWGWDVLTTYFGVRYLKVDEDFVFNTRNAAGQTGILQINTRNDAVGLQVGSDWTLPIGRLASTTKLKAGVMANFDESTVYLRDNATVLIENNDDSVDFSAMAEFGYYVSYAITPRLSIRGGYEAWYVYGLALPLEQVSNPLSSTSGRKVDGEGDTFYHGGIAGVEFWW